MCMVVMPNFHLSHFRFASVEWRRSTFSVARIRHDKQHEKDKNERERDRDRRKINGLFIHFEVFIVWLTIFRCVNISLFKQYLYGKWIDVEISVYACVLLYFGMYVILIVCDDVGCRHQCNWEIFKSTEH